MAERWRDPAQRAFIMRGQRLQHEDPAFVEAVSKKAFARWSDPVRKAELLAARVPKIPPEMRDEIIKDTRDPVTIAAAYGLHHRTVRRIKGHQR